MNSPERDNKGNIYQKYEGIPITIEANGDLIFHCGSINKAKKTIHSLCRELFIKKEAHNNE